jgi:hypothetical protein
MLNRAHTGLRCATQQLVRTVEGNLPRGSQGTLVYEIENLGRRLILVNWDNGFSVPVFPHEIDVEHRVTVVTTH